MKHRGKYATEEERDYVRIDWLAPGLPPPPRLPPAKLRHRDITGRQRDGSEETKKKQ